MLLLFVVVLISFTSRENQVYYIPFDIPGSQMATTLPPFGIFIESKYEGKRPVVDGKTFNGIHFSVLMAIWTSVRFAQICFIDFAPWCTVVWPSGLCVNLPTEEPSSNHDRV